MNVIQVIRERIAANPTLLALLPMRRVVTAPAPALDSAGVPFTAAAAPYCVVTEGVGSQRFRTSHSNYYAVSYTLSIRADQYTKGRAIRDLLLAQLPDMESPLALGGLYDFALENSNYLCEDADPALTIHHFNLAFQASISISRSSSGS